MTTNGFLMKFDSDVYLPFIMQYVEIVQMLISQNSRYNSSCFLSNATNAAKIDP